MHWNSRWNLHGIIIETATNNANLGQAWQRIFSPLPRTEAAPDLQFRLNLVADMPAPPPGPAQFRQGDLLAYYTGTTPVTAHFPRFGQLRLDLENGQTEGEIIPAALETYGVFEDLLAIGLSPHLRRRGLFLVHAFAAAYQGQALLLVGEIGAGKTTTGLALLQAGWQLLANDAPILTQDQTVLQYPGLLAAYPESFARFERTASFLAQAQGKPQRPAHGRAKLSLAAEEIWPEVWLERAPLAAIVFPRITRRDRPHHLEPLSKPEALRRLLPHAIEQWDQIMIPQHLALLRGAVEAAPAYQLDLGLVVETIPEVLKRVVAI